MNPLLQDADLCVKCGMCLPHCPTYQLTGNENESPRGRIALVQAFASGQLDANRPLLSHIDNCLLCRACEKVCPAEVSYGRLIDRFRAFTRRHRRFIPAVALLKSLVIHPSLSRWAEKGLHGNRSWHLERTGLLRWLKMGAINRLLSPLKGDTQALLQRFYPVTKPAKGEVALFAGCMGVLLDRQTLLAACKCLNAAGFAVHVPIAQTCCGALALHDGDAKTAERLAETNRRAFSLPNLTAIVSVASGCGAHLKEHEAASGSANIADVSRFLVEHADFSNRLASLQATVCLHSPCSLKNVMREEQGAANLLRQIPGLNLVELPKDAHCCGAAGSYVLKHPEMAKALLDRLLDAVAAAEADYLITSNIGCALHFAAGLREREKNTQVLHPVVLLSQQLIEGALPAAKGD